MAKVTKYPCIESTVDITLERGQLRLWINETDLHDDYEEERKEYLGNTHSTEKIIDFIKSKEPVGVGNKELIEFIIANVPRLNAVQILSKNGDVRHGVVVYTVDFENHG